MERSLERLKKIKLIGQKENRTVDLIADFDSTGYAIDFNGKAWFFCVPKFFYESLDIKFTIRKINNVEERIWTQGSWFNFSEGDKLYNYAYAYCSNFIREASSIYSKICLSIESAQPSLPLIKKKHVQKDRYPGKINFKIMIQNPATNIWETHGNESLSQDEFITLLIKGLPKEWKIY
jgi:hypothetical protein